MRVGALLQRDPTVIAETRWLVASVFSYVLLVNGVHGGLRDLRNALAAGGSKGVEDGKQTSRLNVTKETSRKRSKKKQRKAGPYPKFQILDGTLVKVGWSKRGKAEYHQRIPEGAFHRVTSALGELSSVGNGSRPSDEILAMVDTGGEAVPSYQTYAVLRFLRDRGVIRMASRGEYVIPPDVTERARTAFVGTEATS